MNSTNKYFGFILLVIFGAVLGSCKQDLDDEALKTFLQKAKKCQEPEYNYLLECQKQELAAYEEYKSCNSSCLIHRKSCPPTDIETLNACVRQRDGEYSNCRDACFENYRAKILQVEKCRNGWEAEFWKCLSN